MPDVASSARARSVTYESQLPALVGAHPRALREVFGRGRVTDPEALGMAPRGRLLALEPLQAGFLLLRPVVRALGGELSPWRGKMFDHGGNAGQNLVFGRRVTRFRALVAPSYVDGQPALQLRYDEPAFGNPWPVRNLVDELRTLSDGVAMGPILFASANGERHVVAWFGLERAT